MFLGGQHKCVARFVSDSRVSCPWILWSNSNKDDDDYDCSRNGVERMSNRNRMIVVISALAVAIVVLRITTTAKPTVRIQTMLWMNPPKTFYSLTLGDIHIS